jgi:glycosyltransferase involved in cell wall biosynthesis
MDFTIITVCLNAGLTIGQTLSSVVRQRGIEFESIVIDGGSRDNTMAVVRSFGNSISYVVSEPDKGIYDAMNKGLAQAKGGIIAFLNADDYYADETVLADVQRGFLEHRATMVAGTVMQIHPDGRVVRRIAPAHRKLSKLRWGVAPPHPGMFCSTRLVREHGGFDASFRYAGDFDLFARLSQSADHRIHLVDRTLAYMRIGGASTRGKLVYFKMSPELKRSLKKNRIGGSPWRVDFRILWKWSELVSPVRRRLTAVPPLVNEG